MACNKCHSEKQNTFNAEINIHLPGYKGLAESGVWVFPELLVCLDCGLTQFSIAETELLKLANGATP